MYSEMPSIFLVKRYFGCIFEDKINSAIRPLNEGWFKTFPKNKVVEHILKTYNICLGLDMFESGDYGGYVMKDDDLNHINVIIINRKEIRSVKSSMSMCGWFLASEKNVEDLDSELITDIPLLKGSVVCQFEPLHQETIGDFYKRFLLKDGNYLFHLTPSINLKKIKREGLCPKHKDKDFIYPDRIYLFGKKVSGDINEWANILFAFESNKEYKGEYSFLRINLTKCGKDIKLYKDPNMEGGLYTTDNIPPEAIEEETRITINNELIDKLKEW